MKKEIFLSFKPEFFRPILYGMKKYEYRKRFCKEETRAFLYLTSPVREVVGIIEFGAPVDIEGIMDTFSKKADVYRRLEACMISGEKLAIPIISLRLCKKPIHISKIKSIDPSFTVPRSYLNIRKYKSVYEYLDTRELYDPEFYNSHEAIYADNIAMTCEEMERSIEFREKDKLYTADDKYLMIKCGYIGK